MGRSPLPLRGSIQECATELSKVLKGDMDHRHTMLPCPVCMCSQTLTFHDYVGMRLVCHQ